MCIYIYIHPGLSFTSVVGSSILLSIKNVPKVRRYKITIIKCKFRKLQNDNLSFRLNFNYINIIIIINIDSATKCPFDSINRRPPSATRICYKMKSAKWLANLLHYSGKLAKLANLQTCVAAAKKRLQSGKVLQNQRETVYYYYKTLFENTSWVKN